MDTDAFLGVGEEWSELVRRDGVAAHVAVFEAEESIGWDVLEAMERAAEEGKEHGIDRWAIVADGVKRLAIKNHVDAFDLEVMATDEFEEAMAWAKA